MVPLEKTGQDYQDEARGCLEELVDKQQKNHVIYQLAVTGDKPVIIAFEKSTERLMNIKSVFILIHKKFDQQLAKVYRENFQGWVSIGDNSIDLGTYIYLVNGKHQAAGCKLEDDKIRVIVVDQPERNLPIDRLLVAFEVEEGCVLFEYNRTILGEQKAFMIAGRGKRKINRLIRQYVNSIGSEYFTEEEEINSNKEEVKNIC